MKRSVVVVFITMLFAALSCKQKDISSYQTNEPASIQRGSPSGYVAQTRNRLNILENRRAGTAQDRITSPSPRPVSTSSEVSATSIAAEQSTESLAARKISKNATLSISVEKFDNAYNKIFQMVNGTPGSYIANSSTYISEKGYKYGTMQIRIPSASFNDILVNIKSVGKVSSEYVTSTDFTRDYYDLEANLRTEENYKERLEQIMRVNARNYEEVQDAYNRIRSVQERIDRIKGQMSYINSMTSYSTLNIKFHEGNYTEPTRIGGVFEKVWLGIKSGFTNMVIVLAYIIEYSLTLSILIAFLIAAYIITRRILRKKNANNKL